MAERSLKVLHIITGLNDGGAEGALYRLCLYDQYNQHVVISMMDGGKYGSMLAKAGIPVYSINMLRGQPTLRGLWHLWQLVHRIKPEVIQTWLYHADLLGGVVARLGGVGRIFWGIRHSNLTPGTVKGSTIWVAKLCALISGCVPTRIVSCSQQAVAAHTAIGYVASKFLVIPNGYDLARYAPNSVARARLRQEWNISNQTVLLGMVARFDAQKDHANLLTALGSIKQNGHNWQCVLVGTGMEPDNPTLQQWLYRESVADKVILLGRRNDIPAVMNALDVHVLSSLGEAFPNVLAEAMACGTPCVTTNAGDAALIVGEHGWVVPAQNSAALAQGIAQAIDNFQTDPVQWQVRQSAAREHIIKNFGIEQMCARYNAVWNE